MNISYILIGCCIAAMFVCGHGQDGGDLDSDEIAELLGSLEAELETRGEDLELADDNEGIEDALDDEQFERQTDKLEAPKGNLLPVKPVWPWLRPPCQHPCCVRGEMNIGLGSLYDDVRGSLAGVTVVQEPTSQSGYNAKKPCSKTALLKVNFEKITKEYCGEFCLENPHCGRRMLKIDMDLSADERSLWLFNVGDSISNNGYSGDSNHQSNDAETDGRYPHVTVYSSDVCKKNPSKLAIFSNAIGPTVDHVTLYVSNEHIRITNNAGLDKKVCHRCLYALNGQPDTGPINEDIYIGLNRVVNGYGARNGVGLCSATLTWTCPWN